MAHDSSGLSDGDTSVKVIENELTLLSATDSFGIRMSGDGSSVIIEAFGDEHLTLLPGGTVIINNKFVSQRIEPDDDDSRSFGEYNKRYAVAYVLLLNDGDNQVSIVDLYDAVDKKHSQGTDTFVGAIKSGATQVASGAVAGELWRTVGHATLPDNVVMVGI